MKKAKLGFTLIELMVTIVIMMVIAAAGMATYGQAQIRARNTKRLGDMKAVQATFEQYFAVNNNYDTCNNMATAMEFNLPTEVNAMSYPYTSNCSTTTYCYCAQLEGTNAPGNSGSAANASCSGMGGGTTHFCVKSQQ
jgi:type IV pilus assembly protein PilE